MAFGLSAGAATLLGAVAAPIVGGLISSGASKSASNVQADASNRVADIQKQMYDQNQQNLRPYMQGGNVALSSLMGKLHDGSLGGSFTPQDYLANKDPGYQFQLDQGNQALRPTAGVGYA